MLVAVPAAVSSATVLTCTNTIVGSAPIFLVSTSNLPELTRYQEQDTEDAWRALAQEKENNRRALLRQRVSWEANENLIEEMKRIDI